MLQAGYLPYLGLSPGPHFYYIAVAGVLQLDLPLSLIFYKWLLGQEHTLTASALSLVDPVLAKSFEQLDEVLRQKKRIDHDRSHVSYC